LRHLCSGYGIQELTKDQRSEFLLKWAKRSQYSWKELIQHKTHGLGYEHLPKNQIKKRAPDHLAQTKYMVFRHDANLPVVGFKAGNVFYALWVEARYGDVYQH
jgi:hypothetical protein